MPIRSPGAEDSASTLPGLAAAMPPEAGDVEVRVYMFGMICQTSRARQTTLHLPRNATVGDILNLLGARYGEAFLAQVMRAAGRMASYSSIAVDGYLVRDLARPVAAEGARATVEIIMLTGYEGG